MRNFLIIAFLLPLVVNGQELTCKVTVNVGPRVQTTDRSIFQDMQTVIEQFMNSRKWTGDVYRSHEKINCAILININEMPSIGSFSASVQVQSARPVFGSSYTTLLLNFADRDWDFDYVESQPLEYNDNSYTSNLTSMLAFYAYLVIGMDYDSFAELGGTPFFQKAQIVVNTAQSSNRPGWQALGSNRNRYWIVENLLNPQFLEMRKSLYSYHRLGLDAFSKTPDKSRQVILESLKSVNKMRGINPNAILIIAFLDAKSKEIASVFSSGNIQIRREAYDLITTLDPSNKTNYENIIKN